ncbi:hypothetical protein PYCC9005_000581 [Savitreella phatthalungensis]
MFASGGGLSLPVPSQTAVADIVRGGTKKQGLGKAAAAPMAVPVDVNVGRGEASLQDSWSPPDSERICALCDRRLSVKDVDEPVLYFACGHQLHGSCHGRVLLQVYDETGRGSKLIEAAHPRCAICIQVQSHRSAVSQLDSRSPPAITIELQPSRPHLQASHVNVIQQLDVLMTISTGSQEAHSDRKLIHRASCFDDRTFLTEELRRRVAHWNGLDLETVGGLLRRSNIEIGFRGIWKTFSCYLFEHVLVCITESQHVSLPPGKPYMNLLVKGVLKLVELMTDRNLGLDAHLLVLKDRAGVIYQLVFPSTSERSAWESLMTGRHESVSGELADSSIHSFLDMGVAELDVIRELATPATQFPSQTPRRSSPTHFFIVLPAIVLNTRLELACIKHAIRRIERSLDEHSACGLLVYDQRSCKVLLHPGQQALQERLKALDYMGPMSEAGHCCDSLQNALQLAAESLVQTRCPSRHIFAIVCDRSSKEMTESHNELPPLLNTKLHIFGYGLGHDPVLLSRLSSAGGGTYTFVRDVFEFELLLVNALETISTLTREDFKFTVKASRSAALAVRLKSLNAEAIEPCQVREFSIGHLPAGGSRKILLTFEVTAALMDMESVELASIEPQDHQPLVLIMRSHFTSPPSAPPPLVRAHTLDLCMIGLMKALAEVAAAGNGLICGQILVQCRQLLDRRIACKLRSRSGSLYFSDG